MQIALLGQTDKRALLYSMLAMCENLGDCCVITNDRKFMRLMEEGPAWEGSYRNIDIFVTDATVDDVFQEIAHSPSDYEYVFFDNLYPEQCDVAVYVMGAGPEEVDELVLAAFEEDEYIHVKMGAPEKKQSGANNGKGKGKDKAPPSKAQYYNIPYSQDIPANIEFCEYYKMLKPISPAALKVAADIMAKATGISGKTLATVAQSKKGGGK